MDMGPDTETYKDIEIRYGYSPRDDVYYAHFALPSRKESGGLLQFVRMDVSSVMPGRHKACAATAKEVLESAHAVIDRYLKA